jgi:hypothetical protein
MNFFNDVKSLDLPITLGGHIEIYSEVFNYIIFNNLEVGITYIVNLFYNGVPLSIDGEDISPLIFTIPYNAEQLSVLSLCNTYEEFIRESDLIKDIYKEKNLDPYDESVPLSIFENYDLSLSLVCIKKSSLVL